jgi:hypothetical protein
MLAGIIQGLIGLYTASGAKLNPKYKVKVPKGEFP